MRKLCILVMLLVSTGLLGCVTDAPHQDTTSSVTDIESIEAAGTIEAQGSFIAMVKDKSDEALKAKQESKLKEIEEKAKEKEQEEKAKEEAEEEVEELTEEELDELAVANKLEEPTYYEQEYVPEYVEPIYYEPEYVEPVYEDTPNASDVDLRSAGVVYEDGTKYTWYSENVLPGGGLTELNNNGRTVDDQGFVVDGDGYIAVASSDYEIGTVVDTPYGQGKVYDSGCASGTIDIYTSW